MRRQKATRVAERVWNVGQTLSFHVSGRHSASHPGAGRLAFPFEKESCYAMRIRRRLYHANKDSHEILECHRQQDSVLGRLTN